jgi:hypothetical protein
MPKLWFSAFEFLNRGDCEKYSNRHTCTLHVETHIYAAKKYAAYLAEEALHIIYS